MTNSNWNPDSGLADAIVDYSNLTPEDQQQVDSGTIPQQPPPQQPPPPQIPSEGLQPIDATQQATQQTTPSPGGIVEPLVNTAKGIHRAISGNQWPELRAWASLPEGPERAMLREKYFQTYYGMPYEEFKDTNLFEQTMAGFRNTETTASSIAAASSMGLLDIPMDLIGLFPGGDKLDEGWDEATAFKSPLHTAIRKLSTVVIPTFLGGAAISTRLAPLMGSSKIPWVTKALTSVGAYGALDATIMGLTDVGEDDSATRALVDFFPEVFGPDGSVPLPEFLVTLDSDSPSIRKQKNMYEAAGLSIATDILSYWVGAGKPTLKWFRPKDKTAFKFKNAEISTYTDNELLIQLKEIDELISNNKGNLSKVDKNTLLAQRQEIVTAAKSAGSFEEYVKNSSITRESENNAAAIRKLNNSDDPLNLDIDGDVAPLVTNDAASARQSVPPGNVARNMIDTTVIKNNSVNGTPAPIVTESMRTKALRVGNTSRDVVMGIAERARDAGEFDAVVDGFRASTNTMNDAAYKIYRSIINADNLDDVKNLFLRNKQVVNLGESVFKNLKEGKKYQSIAEENEALGGALYAIKDLTDRFLGRAIMQSSARVMDTLGREVSDIAEAAIKLSPDIDDDRAIELILDKMEFLMQEVAINKFTSSWQLKNFDRWYNEINRIDDPIDAITTLKSEFGNAEELITNKAKNFVNELRRLQKENPLALRPLVTQFERSGGDVDTLDKLMVWARNQVTPLGLIQSPDPKHMNKFAQGVWAVGYNNILSGLAAGRAVLGNTAGLMSKPITAFLGGTLEGLTSGGDFTSLKRSLYYYGGVAETNRRILTDAWKMAKKSWRNPDALLESVRKDMVQAETIDWDTLEGVRELWVEEDNWGRIMQLDFARMNYDLSRWAPLRAGMVALQSADAGLNAAMATYVSRVRAYDEVFSKGSKIDVDSLALAEKKHYRKIFDKQGLLNDEATKVISGEIALNNQDWLADQINKAVTKYPFMKSFFMFPRTLTNNMKLNLSWSGIQAIPGLTKYGDVIWAQTDDQIANAMRRHGIDMNTVPNARTIFENLRTEYRGRMAFSSLLATTLFSYAMSGNVRGNGSHEATQRRVDRDQFGFTAKTIKIGDKWVSYKGIPMVDPVLTLIGDLGYHARDLNHSIIEDSMRKLTWTIAATFLNESVFTGIEPLVAFTNGDTSWFSRHAANTTRIFLPMSGAAGVISKAIDSAQKDIHDNILHYIMNRTPIMSTGLPKQVDVWTGGYLNDIENPVLRIINALSPVQVSGTEEPWRVDLRDSGYDGLNILKKDSTGSYEYTASEREQINMLVGQQEIYKEVQKILNRPGYQEQIGKLRAHRASGDDLSYNRITIGSSRLPVFRAIDQVVRRAQKIAENQLFIERPDIIQTIRDQRLVNLYMKSGDVDSARDTAERNQTMVENLINLPK